MTLTTARHQRRGRGNECGAIMGKKAGYRTVKGKMGVFGWISRIVLVIFNAIMIGWVVSVPGNVDEAARRTGGFYTESEQTAATGISIVLIIVVWAAGTVILGIWALLTRPPRTLVPLTED